MQHQAWMLKNCAAELSELLFILFRHSIDDGEVPNLLKDAVIVPNHRGGLKSQPQNYRPINLEQVIMRLMSTCN